MLSEEKYCSKCGKWLFLIDFREERLNKYRSECKECQKEVAHKNREKYKKDQHKRFRAYKNGAAQRELEFRLTFKEFIGYWQKSCYYCRSKIDTIGLDRRDNSKGYTKKNIVPCCKICNWMKLASTEESFIEQCKRISRVKI